MSRFKKSLAIVMCSGLLISAQSFADRFDDDHCGAVFEGIAQNYIEANRDLFSIYADNANLNDDNMDTSTFRLMTRHDIDPGSWNLRREATFKDRFGSVLVLYTMGDLWCDDERVLGIKELRRES